MYCLAELAPRCAGASPGIEVTGAVKNVSDEELKWHPEVKLSGRVSEKEGLSGCLPGSRRGVVLSWLLRWVLEEKVSGKGHMRTNAGYRSANFADSYFKSSPAFTDCNKKLLNFLCDLTVFLSG